MSTTSVRVFEQKRVADLVANISGDVPLFGTFNDWPAVIQDGIYKTLEKASEATGVPWTIVFSRSDIDHETKVPFVHVIAEAPIARQ